MLVAYVFFVCLVLALSEYVLILIDGCKIFERQLFGTTLDIVLEVVEDQLWNLLTAFKILYSKILALYGLLSMYLMLWYTSQLLDY